MTLARRLDKIAASLGRDDDGAPALLIVMQDREGRWWQGGEEIDPATVDPRTRVVVLSERRDGPQ